MAQFCTKCGSPLAEGMKFCTGCGATIGEQSAPAAAQPPAPVAAAQAAPPAPVAAPVAPAAAAPAPSKGSPILKIILLVLGGVFLLSVLAVAAGVYYYYTRIKPRVTQIEEKIHQAYPTPSGTREVHPQPPAPSEPAAPALDMGVPVYPGATPTEGQGEMPMGAGGFKVQQYTTPDSLEKVLAFYKDKLGPKAVATQSGDSALVQVVGSNGVINISIASDSAAGKTTFTITSIQK